MGPCSIMPIRESFLSEDVPSMGIYETLYAFRDSWGAFMGTQGTHPWSQGFPLTTKLKDGPELPPSVEVTWEDRFYPKAWGHPLLREAIVNMYNDHYGSKIEPDNVMVFAGGRCAIFTVLLFLKKNVQVRIGNAEWPAYLDIMTQAGIDWKTVKLDHSNNFHPPNSDYFDRTGLNAKTRVFPVISNPGNPTGHTRYGNELKELIEMAEQSKNGILLDEAYEFYHETSKKNIETLSNFSSFGMGGVSHPSQLYAVKLLEKERLKLARSAVSKHFGMQRERYGKAFKEMGLKVYTGDGGFYHWMELPEGLNADDFNKRLFKKGAAILKGSDCDMERPHAKGSMPSAKSEGDPEYVTPYTRMFRFSFGPLLPETFESDIKLFRQVYEEYKKDMGV